MRRLPFFLPSIIAGFAISLGASAAPSGPATPRTFLLRGAIHSVNPNSSPNGSFEIAAEPPTRFIQSELRSYVERETGRVIQEAKTFGFDGKRTIYQPSIPEYQQRAPELVTATPAQERAIRSAAEEALRRIQVPLTSTDPTPPDRVGTIRYSDYRTIDGVRVPFRIELGAEVWIVRDAQINVALPPKLFRR